MENVNYLALTYVQNCEGIHTHGDANYLQFVLLKSKWN